MTDDGAVVFEPTRPGIYGFWAIRFDAETEGEIHISHVRTSCGCTTPILPEKVIAPGAIS